MDNTLMAPLFNETAGLVRPLVNVDKAVEAFNEYQQLKDKLRQPGDFIEFTDRKGNTKEAPTKGWRSKLTRFFGISCEIIEEHREDLPDGTFIYHITAKATAPNGLTQVGDGMCWSKTKENSTGDLYHNTRSHAFTRAKNRAVFELVGFGEVSAEELDLDPDNPGKKKIAEPKAKSNGPKPQLSEPQVKRFFAISQKTEATPDMISIIQDSVCPDRRNEEKQFDWNRVNRAEYDKLCNMFSDGTWKIVYSELLAGQQ